MRIRKTYILLLALIFMMGVLMPIIASTGYGPGVQPTVPPFVPPEVSPSATTARPTHSPRFNTLEFTTGEETLQAATNIVRRAPRLRRLFISIVNPGEIDASNLWELFALAARNQVPLILQMDTVDEYTGEILARIVVDYEVAAHLNGGMNFLAITDGEEIYELREVIEFHFENDFTVVRFRHRGAFGVANNDNGEEEYIFVRASVSACLLELYGEDILIYAFNSETEVYAYLDTNHEFDDNGFLHFYTPVGGDIIFTDSVLTRR